MDAPKQESAGCITVTITPLTKIKINECRIFTDEKISSRQSVFLNGYQTWTDSRETDLTYSVKPLSRLLSPIMKMYGDYGFYKYSPDKLASFTYTYIRDPHNGRITLYGSLNERTGYTIFEYLKSEKKLSVLKDCAGFEPEVGKRYCAFEIFIEYGDEEKVFDDYFEAACIPKPRVAPCVGWTSWYNYYNAVTQKDVLDNLEAFRSRGLPIDIFQIDDGYQEAVGDWLRVNGKFPDGMRYVADKIKECGYKAGLWLAPLVCEKKSQIYKQHPDWVVAKAGFNPLWSGVFYVLDFYNEGVRDYLRKVFDTVFNEWHYDMVKLDFLYAAALINRKDKTRGQIMYEFMQFLRELCGDKIILGCGVPLGCAFGLVDYCRVSSDVALKWEDNVLARLHYRERTSTINALTSTIGRRHLNGRAFYNDPDVFILRSGNNQLTEDQKYTLFMINKLLGGLFFASDNISEYDDRQMSLYRTIFEMKDKKVLKVESKGAVYISYSIGERDYCLVSNLSEKEATVTCPCAGRVNGTGEIVESGRELSLRPCQSVVIEIAPDKTLAPENQAANKA